MKSSVRILVVSLVLLLLGVLTATASEQVFNLDPEQTAVRFNLKATGHDVEGFFHVSEGSIGFDPESGRAWGEIIIDTRQSAKRHLVDRLRPSCSVLDWRETPGIRSLRHLIHLHKPVKGRLRRRSHVLEWVDELHPTPAIAGAPTAVASDWIARHEPSPRGWYAGPLGWIDRRGDGDLWIALRSALLRDGLAHLWAGAGIVAGSDPDAEALETEVKLQAMIEVLSPLARGGGNRRRCVTVPGEIS